MSERRRALRKPPNRFGVVNVAAWIVYVFLITPTLIVIPMSFGSVNELVFPPQEWSLDLYRTMLDPTEGWLSAARRSLIIGVLSTVCATILGVSAAYGLVRGRFRGKKAVGFLLLSPIFAPTVVLALALYLYFMHLGVAGSLAGVVVGHTLVVTPFVIVTTMTGLRHIDQSIETVAVVMGATRVQVFAKVVLPQVKPAILSGALFAFLLSFDEVVISFFVASSSKPTLPVKMYSSIQWEISPVLAAISAVMIAVTCLIAFTAAAIQPSKNYGD